MAIGVGTILRVVRLPPRTVSRKQTLFRPVSVACMYSRLSPHLRVKAANGMHRARAAAPSPTRHLLESHRLGFVAERMDGEEPLRRNAVPLTPVETGRGRGGRRWTMIRRSYYATKWWMSAPKKKM